jgi:protein-tyrosine phosphatase
MAEVLLRHHLAGAGVEATVSSAGIYEGGAPATGHGIAAMAERGLDLRGHRSRRMDETMVQGADLVIGMAREHVREAAVLDRDALTKTFTLKELVTLAEAAGPRGPDEPLASYLSRVASTRVPSSLLGLGHNDALDVEDPVGRGRRDYEVTADLLDGLLRRVVELAFPSSLSQERTA